VSLLVNPFMAAPPAPSELWVQPDFDASTGITLNGWVISGGEARAPANSFAMVATALEALTPGQYQVVINKSANPDGTTFRVLLAGTAAANTNSALGEQTLTITVTTVSNQLITVRDNFGDGGGDKITALSVKKIS
jgi:hypothetical protein